VRLARREVSTKGPERERLVKAVRKHAALLLKLADEVEREGHERAATQYQLQ